MYSHERAQQKKFIMMTTTPINKLVLRLAIPSIITMLVTAIYNMADTFFVARLDIQSPAAVGIIFSYMSFIQAVAFFFGQGSANYISRALGAKDRKNAELMASTGFFTALIVGVIISIIGFVCMDEILKILGSTETILPYSRAYFKYILIGTPLIMASFVMNNQMRFQGNAWMGMMGIATGAILNIFLDPIFIFIFKMGVAGASLATMLSQCLSFSILIYMTRRGDEIPLSIKNFKPTFAQYKEITAGGLPSLGRQGLASVAVAYLNHSAGLYGDLAIAAMSVVNRVVIFSSSIVIGFGQGFQPVCGFNYGAKIFERVKQAFNFSVIFTTVYCVILSVIGYFFGANVIALFRPDDAELIELGAMALKFQSYAFIFVGYITMSNMYLQSTRKTIRASILAASRQGFMLALALYVCKNLFGLTGIAMAQPVADFLSFMIAVPFSVSAISEMKN